MLRIIGIAFAAATLAATLAATGALAQDVKVGVVLPLTGGLAPVGKQVQAGIKMYMDKNGASVVGKKIDLIVKDDASVPDNSKRLAQELIVNDKAAVIGSALTPSAMAIGPLSTQSKTANVLFAVEATRRWAADGIFTNALMPGGIRTNLQRYVSGDLKAI